ncbi:hypothetical protein K490DRAFT_57687 [Saccharata proteae CBS 121410]|uniref:Uncharacterized protein n=1 Tax=Saccharata proteae CBS 121410 TaxID=1314787 RepID=A0A9P4LUR7_9PEZI|nr:hypothetical protein K490DRAFT_57687 [Saccharata proteae CBS 121410]
MASPSPKRRKTSPATGVSGDVFQPRNALRRTPPRRPSFMSPTRASMSRFNPDLAARPRSAGRELVEDVIERGQGIRKYILGETDAQPDTQPDAQPDARTGATPAEQDVDSTTRRPHSEPDPIQAAVNEQVSQESVRHAARVQTDRGLYPPELSDDDLPIASSHLGSPLTKPDPPPRGALFSSSPSKKPRRNKALGQRLSASPRKPSALRSSPLKPAARAKDFGGTQAQAKGGKERKIASVEADESSPTGPAQRVGNLSKPAADPKHHEKQRLKKRIEELQGDVAKYELELERSQAPRERRDTDDCSDLISLINSSILSSQGPGTQAPPLSSVLTSFLPLAKPVPLPTPPPEDEEPFPSHEPISLQDPIPHLRLFTDFTYESKIRLDKAKTPLYQIHTMTMRSPGQILNTSYEMTLDSSDSKIIDLKVLSISPWCCNELITWIKCRAQEKDVSGLCWAVNSYWDIATKRAQCWTRCRGQFANLLEAGALAQKAGPGARDKSKKNRQQHNDPETIEDEEEEVSGIGADLGSPSTGNRMAMTRTDLIHDLGRDSLVLCRDPVRLKVSWRIKFDWTGEAESVISADAALPASWRESDERNSLKKIPEVFELLAAEHGVFEAIRVMAGLLFA